MTEEQGETTPNVESLSLAVRKQQETLDQLKSLPHLVQELSNKVGRVKDANLNEPPASMFSPISTGGQVEDDLVDQDYNQLLNDLNGNDISKRNFICEAYMQN